MERIIRLGKTEYTLRASAMSLIIYRAAHSRDALTDIDYLCSDDLDAVLRFWWAFMKTAYRETPAFAVWLQMLGVRR